MATDGTFSENWWIFLVLNGQANQASESSLINRQAYLDDRQH
jgi:hypothetical protein